MSYDMDRRRELWGYCAKIEYYIINFQSRLYILHVQKYNENKIIYNYRKLKTKIL